jgi:hypothetical protein
MGIGRSRRSQLRLRPLALRFDILQMTGNTAWWTARLARRAEYILTVLDASPETLNLNPNRVGRPDVDYVVADLVHVAAAADLRRLLLLLALPRAAVTISASWSLVRSCLARGGSGIPDQQPQRPASNWRDQGPLRPPRSGPEPAPIARREQVPGRRGLLRARGVADTSWPPRLDGKARCDTLVHLRRSALS